MKKIFFVILFLLMTNQAFAFGPAIQAAVSAGGAAAFACTEDVSYTAGTTDTAVMCDGAANQWVAIQFTTGAGVTSVCQTSVEIHKSNSPTMDIVGHIFADSGSDLPTGSSLGNSNTINAATLPAAAGTYTPYTFAITGLSAGTKYWLAFRCSATSGINTIRWVSADSIGTGVKAKSADTAGAPASWGSDGTRSYHYKTYQNNK
jgi:hypothetical protein